MKNPFKIITLVIPAILIYWLATKFITINNNKFLSALYEMSALIFVAFTMLIPVFIIYLLLKNKKELNGKHTVYGGLLLLFALANIVVMTWEAN